MLWIFLAAAPAFADLLTNGGFEQGDFAGWTLLDANHTYVATAGFDGLAPANGSYFAVLGTVDTPGLLNQTFADTPGALYLLSFSLTGDGYSPNDLTVLLNGNLLFSAVDISAGAYQVYSLPFSGTGTEDLSFVARDDPGYLALDDVSVSVAAETPEPATFALLATGLSGLGVAVRRRSRRGYSASCWGFCPNSGPK